MRLLALMFLALLSGGCTVVRPAVIQPQPPQRGEPPECRVAVEEPVEEHAPPAELELPCTQVDHDEWAVCVAAKATELARLKELDRADKRIERRRRKACVDFLDGKLP